MSRKTRKEQGNKVRGEGDCKSARKFDRDEQDFVKSRGVERAAHETGPKADGKARMGKRGWESARDAESRKDRPQPLQG